jgi:Animal haem peroxidase.
MLHLVGSPDPRPWTPEPLGEEKRRHVEHDKFMSEDILIASIEGTMHEMFNSGGVPGGMAQSCPHLPLANFACSPEAQHLECDPQMPYRTITGLCNNLKYPLFGAASTALKRLIPPAYADGRGQPRGTRFSSLANDFSKCWSIAAGTIAALNREKGQ